MTLWDKCTALLKSGCNKDRGFVVDMAKDLYHSKGDETEVTTPSVRRLNQLYTDYFNNDRDAMAKRLVRKTKRMKS